VAWQDRIRGTLGASDHKFANHQSEREEAVSLLLELVGAQIDFATVETEYRLYMTTNGYSPMEVASVITELQLLFGAWL
jgi:hypothetical protein